MYKTREGVKSLLKDRKRSNDNDTIYDIDKTKRIYPEIARRNRNFKEAKKHNEKQ